MAKRILSVQSHVVRGYVGNKSATFPLQVLGFEVDAINSVQFTNHTQYKHCTGQILKSHELADLIDGLRKNELLGKYSHLLTGYIGDAGFLIQTVECVKELKKLNPDLIYVCDPVMGDNGKFYVSETVLPVYQDEVLRNADVVTPNQFEIEQLTGITISSISDAVKAIKCIHKKGPKVVIISSSSLGDKNNLLLIASSQTGEDTYSMITQRIPLLPAVFVGTGDLFTSLLLAWLTKAPLREACHKVISTMQHILHRTLENAKVLSGNDNPSIADLELQLIQSIQDIQNPTLNIPEPEALNL